MQLDAGTLFICLIIVTALSGGLLLWVWSLNRQVQALNWWGWGHLVAATGLAMLSGRGFWPDRITIDLGNALIMVAYGFMWNSARAFAGLRQYLVLSLAPAIIWLLTCQIPAFYASLPARALLYSVLCSVAAFAITPVFLRIREPLPARYPIAIVTGLHGIFFVFRAVAMTLAPDPEAAWPFWFSATGAEGIIYVFACAFLLLALAKSRAELQYKLASEVDFLTKVANRGGFYAQAQPLLMLSRVKGLSSAVLVFDLNDFKAINDTYGHQAGDRVLQVFGRIAGANLRRSDVLGRLGGDEFAALLTQASAGEARDIADRIAAKFTEAMRAEPQFAFQPTVSAGMAISPDSSDDLQKLIDRADRELYLAKPGRRVSAVQAF